MKPAFLVSLNSDTLEFKTRGTTISLTDNGGFQADELSITVADPDSRIELPRKGVQLGLQLGWHHPDGPKVVDKGRFTVDELQYSINPRTITIVACSANFRKALVKVQNKSWRDTTVTEIVSEIAKNHKLIPSVDARYDSRVIDHLDQANESDGHLLTRLALLLGAITNVKNNYLIFMPKGQGITPGGTVLQVQTIDVSQLTAASYAEVDRNSQFTGAKAKWRDTDKNKITWEVAGDPTNTQRLKPLFASQSEAQTAAATQWQQQRQGEFSLEISLAVGRPELITETPVQTTGIKPEIDAKNWIVESVSHEISDGGYVTAAALITRSE